LAIGSQVISNLINLKAHCTALLLAAQEQSSITAGQLLYRFWLLNQKPLVDEND